MARTLSLSVLLRCQLEFVYSRDISQLTREGRGWVRVFNLERQSIKVQNEHHDLLGGNTSPVSMQKDLRTLITWSARGL